MERKIDDRDLPRRLKQAGQVIRDAAADNAALWSNKVPQATRVKGGDRGGDTYVTIETNGTLAPAAAPNAYGESHPLFARIGSRRYADGRWYADPHRPYLDDAVNDSLERAIDAFEKVIDDWCDDLGFD
jgi:hypothetical protein